MHRITLLCVGSLKTSWIKAGVKEYADRIAHTCSFDILEVPPGKQKDPEKQREEESNALIRRLDAIDGDVWVLDEHGTEMSSQKFSNALEVLRDRGVPVTFVLGGAYGLSDAVKQSAHRVIALSAMTLPHELCRLVFLEQLYRAQEISKGSGYHH